MHARGPPMNVRRWPHTPGMLDTASGRSSDQRSGRNSPALGPQSFVDRLIARIGMKIGVPFEILLGGGGRSPSFNVQFARSIQERRQRAKREGEGTDRMESCNTP